MTDPSCRLMIDRGLPFVVWQALADRRLQPWTRLAMLQLAQMLDFNEYRDVKGSELQHALGCGLRTANRAISELVHSGYLEVAPRKFGAPMCIRMFWSRQHRDRPDKRQRTAA